MIHDILTLSKKNEENKDILKLMEGCDPYRGFNARLDILTPLGPNELSVMVDKEYDDALEKAKIYAKDVNIIAEYAFDLKSCLPPGPEPLTPYDKYMEGNKGPPLSKGENYANGLMHKIIKRAVVRDYEEPCGDYAYFNIRKRLAGNRGRLFITSFEDSKDIPNVVPDSISRLFRFEAKSRAILPEFIFAMMDLYGNYSKGAVKLKMSGIEPTVTEAMVQRDTITKLSGMLQRKSVEFYITLHNPKNRQTIFWYGMNANGESLMNSE